MITQPELYEFERGKIGEFVREYLSRKYGEERLSYDMDFVLDLQELQEMAEQDRRHLLTDDEIRSFTAKLPNEEIKRIFDETLKDARHNKWLDSCQWILQELDKNYEKTMEALNLELQYLVVVPSDKGYPDFHLPSWNLVNEKRYQVTFGELNLSKYEDKTIQLKGFLTYVQNPPTERIKSAEWICDRCGGIEISDGRPPEYCSPCQGKRTWTIDEETIVKERIQEALVTEEYEASACGFQISLSILILNENTGKFAPGDHIAIMGKVKGILTKNKGKEPFYSYMIEVSQIRKEERKVSMTHDEVRLIEEFARNENVLDNLAELYAPGIIGHEDVKKAIVLQAAGADEIVRGGRRVRGNIHILLVGDPGTGKSQLLMAAPQICPKALYVSDASAAGMTAAVDEVNGKRVMVAGVMVLADGAIACIDEIEKMNKDDRKAIHPAMEQGEIHKSKAGLHASFKSRTSVLAAANPIYGRFTDSDPIPRQIDLEPSLLDRFDLIFVFKEKPGTASYEKHRAVAILEGGQIQEDGDFLLKYIMHSKSIHPIIPGAIKEKIAEYFATLKANQENKEHFVNTRTLESLQRLTLASARLRLSDIATEMDFETAKDLVDIYLRQFDFDMDAISGITGTVRDCIRHLRNLISSDASIHEHEILEECRTLGFSQSNVRTAVDELLRTGEIYSPRDGVFKRVSK